jgi:hypothetical protein
MDGAVGRAKAIFRCFVILAVLLVAFLGGARTGFARVDPPHPAVDPRHVDGSHLGGVVDLTSTWLLKQGDDPKYSAPDLDDSQWIVVKAGVPLKSYGLKDVDFVWYRTHVRVPAGAKNLALLLREFAGSEEVFVNGVKVGSSGPFPAGGRVSLDGEDRIDRIPDGALGTGEITVAIRASIGWFSNLGARAGGIGSDTSVLLGTVPDLSDSSSLFDFRAYTSNWTNLSLASLLLLIALTLALAVRSEREYVALVGYLATVVCTQIGLIWLSSHNAEPVLWSQGIQAVLRQSAAIAILEFVRLVLRLRRSRAFVVYEWLLVAMIPLEIAVVRHVVRSTPGHSTDAFLLWVNIFFFVLGLPIDAGLPLLALWAWWTRRSPDALLLFVPLFVQAAYVYCSVAVYLLDRLHIIDNFSLGVVPIPWLYVGWVEVTVFFYSVTLLVFLVLRTLRIARARAEVAAEVAAAQTVQRVLLARASQPTPGFRVESVYLPASEVGGDFFLVSPGPDGSLNAIVGDVSGKGLIAAMRVSMILGVLRREESRAPGRILQALNEALLTQGEMGFTTACCVYMDREGNFAVANAGHISPYVDGEEIAAPPSLPLGLAPEQEFAECMGRLPAGKRMVLMSDGVVEARSASGELYGFDRIPALTRMPAHDIADVAQRFGQEDDITVLTIACEAYP